MVGGRTGDGRREAASGPASNAGHDRSGTILGVEEAEGLVVRFHSIR